MTEQNNPGATTGPTITTTQLAERWHCTTGHLANERSRGTSIPFLRLFSGGRIVYLLSDVLAAEDAARVIPPGMAA